LTSLLRHAIISNYMTFPPRKKADVLLARKLTDLAAATM
jgi:hypothetical protein